MTPMSSAKAKSWMTLPPRMNRHVTTIRVVTEVSVVLLSVSLMLRFISSGRLRPRYCLKFSRILSKTTIVSFRE